jgi:hypothetical protein
MTHILQLVLDWSEVWALFIPLFFLFKFRIQLHFLKSVVVYVCLAFVINLSGNILSDYGNELDLPEWLQRNIFLYNSHSIIRFICFTSFFILLDQPYLSKAKKIIPVLCIPLIIIYFSFVENFNNPNHISGYFLAAEAFLLLLYCMQYYIYRLREENDVSKRGSDFWVVTGLSVYVVINFFVFLFYIPVLRRDYDLADKLWSLHNIAYIIFCIFLAKGFYVSTRR